MVTQKLLARRVLGAAMAALCVTFAPAALAAKGGAGGTSGTSSISLVVLNSTDGLPHWGGEVTFNISTTATTQPYVNLLCYQNGVLVLNAWNGYFAEALNSSRNFGLDSGAWKGGAADCTAWLDMATKRGFQHLASTSFHVYA